MTRNARPYLTMQDMRAVTPGLIGYMQKQALDRINQTIDEFYDQTHSLALRSLFHRLYDTEHLQRSEIAQLFALIEPAVQFDIEQRLLKNRVATVLSDISYLLDGKIQLDYLVPTFDKYKDALMRYMLSYVKSNGITHDFRSMIYVLTKLNISWPELEIMHKSSQSLNEGTYQPNPDTMISMIKTYAGRPGIGPLMSSLFTYKNIGGDMAAIEADAKNTILPVLQKPVRSKNFQALYGYLSQSAVLFDWPELHNIKLSMIPVMLRELEIYTEKPGYADSATYAAHMITMMRGKPNVLDEAKPQLASVINQKKPTIMKDLLTLFKYGNVGPVTSAIYDYRSVGIEWPEFAAIEKSAAVGRKPAPLAEAASLDAPLKHANDNISRLVNSDIMEGINQMSAEEIIAEYHYYPLIMISKLGDHGYTVANPAVATAIDSVKHRLIETMLMLVKDGYHKNIPASIGPIKRLGVNWPELDIIEKSAKLITNTKVVETMRLDLKDQQTAIKKTKPLAEAASPDRLLNYAEKNIKQLVKGNVESFYHLILGLEKLAKGKTDAETNALTLPVLFKHKAAIIDHVDSLVNGKTPEQNINGLFAIQLLKRLGVTWPELRQFIDTRAVDIVKHGLTNYSLTTGLDIMKTVDALGIPKSSIEAGIKAVGKRILDDINSMLDENAVQVGIENRFRLFKRFGINYKMKSGPLKTKMLNRLNTVLSQQGLTPGSVGLIELITNYSADIAATMQEIAALMQKHKTPVVKRLLQDFKNDNTYNLDDYLKTLKQLKLDWPELDIIIKSTRSGLNESLDAITANNAMTVLFRILRVNWQAPKVWERKAYEQFIEDHKQQILDHFRHQAETVWPKDNDLSISTDIFMAMGLQFNGKDWPELKEIFEQNREPIIRQLLKTVKFHQGVNLYAKDILMTLLAMGFKWPELEVLKRSMNSTQRGSIDHG